MPVPGLKAQVVAAIPAVFGMWEGSGLRFMYTDSKGLVTTGTGNLIDPVGVACAIPDWVRADGSPATQGDIVMAWGAVKGAWPKVQSTRCAGLTTLRLTPAGVTRLLMRTVAQDWAYLQRPFPRSNTWPVTLSYAFCPSRGRGGRASRAYGATAGNRLSSYARRPNNFRTPRRSCWTPARTKSRGIRGSHRAIAGKASCCKMPTPSTPRVQTPKSCGTLGRTHELPRRIPVHGVC